MELTHCIWMAVSIAKWTDKRTWFARLKRSKQTCLGRHYLWRRRKENERAGKMMSYLCYCCVSGCGGVKNRDYAGKTRKSFLTCENFQHILLQELWGLQLLYRVFVINQHQIVLLEGEKRKCSHFWRASRNNCQFRVHLWKKNIGQGFSSGAVCACQDVSVQVRFNPAKNVRGRLGIHFEHDDPASW